MKKILIFNPFGIGDVLFTTPLIRNLKTNFDEASISYICNRRTYPLLKNNIFLDKVFVFEKDEWRACARESKWAMVKKFCAFFSAIRKEKFDIVFDLSLNSQYGFFLKAAGIKQRIGYNYKNRGRFLTRKIPLPQGYNDKHIARYYLNLLNFLDITPQDYNFDVFLSPASLDKGLKILEEQNIGKSDFIVGVCPGAGDSWGETAYFKRWPKEYFLKLSEILQNKLSAKIILFGSKAEGNICEYIYNNMEQKPLNLCGKITLEDFIGLISQCGLVIANDGGPFHIAQALQKKTAVFYGPVNDRVYGPYPDEKNCVVFKRELNCRPCYNKFRFPGCARDKKCLRDISVEEVFAKIFR
ncbi:MAG: glycosyltransferase family 9 protein [Candidatus Omnitrophota bacterium]